MTTLREFHGIDPSARYVVADPPVHHGRGILRPRPFWDLGEAQAQAHDLLLAQFQPIVYRRIEEGNMFAPCGEAGLSPQEFCREQLRETTFGF